MKPTDKPLHGVTKSMIIRAGIILILCLAAFALIIHRLYALQIVDEKSYKEMAEAQQLRDEVITPNRGTIYDRDMKVLAESSTVWTIEASPRDMAKYKTDINTLSVKLAEILGIEDYTTVLNKLMKTDTNYQLIKRQVDKPTADLLRTYIAEYNEDERNAENLIVGITIRQDSKRYYRYGSFASTIIGFTNVDGDGMAGLELKYNDTLKGVAGRILAAKNAFGYDMDGQTYEARYEPVQGSGLVLTIDENIQHLVEKNLSAAMKEHDVQKRSVAIAMNPKTGAILAMATMGDYDLNQPFVIADPVAQAAVDAIANDEERAKARTEALYAQRRNKAVQDIYEPGSVYKIITASAALDSGAATLNTSFSCHGSFVVVEGLKPMRCAQAGGHGTLNFAQGLDNSCNPYYIQLGQRMGKTIFCNYLQAFGFMEKTGIDMEDEGRCQVYTEDRMGPTELASSSFGQSSSLTPIAMITAISAAINGGYLVQPYVVEKIVDPTGNVIKSMTPQIKRQVISEETSKIICELLENSVNMPGGHGQNAKVMGYRVGGKSGTSQKLSSGDENARLSSFVGFAPANDPEIVVLMFLDEPNSKTNSSYGGRLVGPVVRDIIRESMPYLGVEPQYTEEELKIVDVPTPNTVGMEVANAQVELNSIGFNFKVVGSGGKVTYQYPAANTTLPRQSTVILYTEDEAVGERVVVPDVSEKTVSFTKKLMQEAGLNIRIIGPENNSAMILAANQNIPSGTEVEKGTLITVNFHDTTVVAED